MIKFTWLCPKCGEQNETADEAEIAAVFEEKYPEFSRNV